MEGDVMSSPDISHLEQAKQHIQQAQAFARTSEDRASLHLVWAINEIIWHIEDPEQ